MDPVIRTENITKTYRDVKAVDSVSLSVNRGEIYGFLGLNGAGKTTTIRMLLGMINPAGGAAFINGVKVDAGQNKLWNSVGYLVETPYAYPELTVRENLKMFASMRGLQSEVAVENIMEKLALTEYADRKAGKLSLGNAQRLGIAKAMMHAPDILILDEPANGLDPAGIVEIRELLKGLAKAGTTVFISSHILSEIARMADRIGIIHRGRLIKEADFDSLDRDRIKHLAIGVKDTVRATKVLAGMGFAPASAQEGLINVDNAAAISSPEAVAEALVKAGTPPYMLKVEEEGLEEYFLRLTGNGGAQ